MSELSAALDEAWMSTCRAVLGGEVGGLEGFAPYLLEDVEPMSEKTSALSGKPVQAGEEYFPTEAVFIGHDEVKEYQQKHPAIRLDINQVKDLDSVLDGIREQAVYVGNLTLGKSEHLEESHRCTNSFYVKRSLMVESCKYVAYCSIHGQCENIFGCRYTREAKFGIRSTQFYRSARCFEAAVTMKCSDCHYTANMEDCSDCMFSFNQKGGRNLIGNRPFAKSEYLKLKAALLEQIRSDLSSKKRVMGLAELLSGARAAGMGEQKEFLQFPKKKPSQNVERSWEDVTAVLLGCRMKGLQDYGPWLFSHARKPRIVRSAKSQKNVLVMPLRSYLAWSDAMLTYEEAWEQGKQMLGIDEARALTIQNARQVLGDLKLATTDLRMGRNTAVEESVNYFDSSDCFFGAGYLQSKTSGYSFIVREGEGVFGSDTLLYSKFCVKCSHSTYLVRCMEVSDSFSSSDCLFCHNVENCQECMFCFNVKAKSYAIGNVEMKKEDYLRVKKLVLDEITAKLEKNKKLEFDIYNIGCKR